MNKLNNSSHLRTFQSLKVAKHKRLFCSFLHGAKEYFSVAPN